MLPTSWAATLVAAQKQKKEYEYNSKLLKQKT